MASITSPFDTSTLPSHSTAEISYVSKGSKAGGDRDNGGRNDAGADAGQKQAGGGNIVVGGRAASKAEGIVTESMRVYDARPGLGKFDIDTHGFVIASLRTTIPETLKTLLGDPEDRLIRGTFWREVEELARRSVRTGDGRYPRYVFAVATQKFTGQASHRIGASGGDVRSEVQGSYAKVAHADFSEVVFDGAYKMFVKRGVPEAEAQDLDIMFVNAWKPYGQTVRDNPLAILDWTSVDPAIDVHVHPRGSPVAKSNGAPIIYVSEVTHSPAHRWVYLPEQRSDEVWLFKQADSRAENKLPSTLAQYGFHVSFALPDDPGKENRTRQSIAIRLILGFERRSHGNQERGPKAAL